MNTVELTRRYLVGSFLLHLLVVVSLFFLSWGSSFQNNFVVFGVHSRKETHAIFIPMRSLQSTKETLQEKKSLPRKQSRVSLAKNKVKQSVQAKKKVVCSKKSVLQKKGTSAAKKKKETRGRKLTKKTPVKKQQKSMHVAGKAKGRLAGMYASTMEFHFEKKIQEAIERVWFPPVGVPKGTECTVKVIINRHGVVSDHIFIQRSDILVFDMSVVQIIRCIAFPRVLWGKQFPINFRQ